MTPVKVLRSCNAKRAMDGRILLERRHTMAHDSPAVGHPGYSGLSFSSCSGNKSPALPSGSVRVLQVIITIIDVLEFTVAILFS